MAAHYGAAHEAVLEGGPFTAQILDDGTKVVQMSLHCEFPDNGEGWFACEGLRPIVFRTAVGGCYAFELLRPFARRLRFGVRSLGRDPARHRLASVTVRFGPPDGVCFQHPLSRALAADERLVNDVLCAGMLPAVGRVDPLALAPTLIPRPGTPPFGLLVSWELSIGLSLEFRVVGGAPP